MRERMNSHHERYAAPYRQAELGRRLLRRLDDNVRRQRKQRRK